MRVKLLSIATIVLLSSQLMADEVRVAVASNFANAITAIAERFEGETCHEVFHCIQGLPPEPMNGINWNAVLYTCSDKWLNMMVRTIC